MASLFPELGMKGNERLFIGVIGEGRCASGITKLAAELGKEIAGAGAILVCGGLGGVMEAACRGAKSAGGLTVGILPGFERKAANPYVDIPIVTGMSYARNLIIVRSCDALIAVAGGFGTLSEIAFGLALNLPVIGLRTWRLQKDDKLLKEIIEVETPEEAVVRALAEIRRRGG